MLRFLKDLISFQILSRKLIFHFLRKERVQDLLHLCSVSPVIASSLKAGKYDFISNKDKTTFIKVLSKHFSKKIGDLMFFFR